MDLSFDFLRGLAGGGSGFRGLSPFSKISIIILDNELVFLSVIYVYNVPIGNFGVFECMISRKH